MGLFNFKKKKNELCLYSPLNGEVKPITESPDPVFSQKMMGDGIVIFPKDGQVVAPFDGKVTMIFPSKHAIGLTSKDGVELLIHYGLDTVNLNGEGFEVFVEVGQAISKGDRLLTANNTLIEENGYSTAVPVVFTALADNQSIEIVKSGEVNQGDKIVIIK